MKDIYKSVTRLSATWRLKSCSDSCSTTVDKTQLQQLKYYNRVLSPEEIYTLYRQYPISRVGLVGEWDMNEPSGNIIRNTSPYGELLDGTTTGTREAVVW